ncbi:hypothetical protein SARC_12231 [Sphaeroforma arctica JP610]|uniref:Uncharacterized protein n=1 Tax=Sphaeroforma arctica JP610 TaxID=667725 RepID=A0A0L0FGS2_9EUKA|nr:hypothetical protein SARC_12231 [Sphaeroforma arctica JP610]KNC75243.1 hypothetical protein SARC_12231 [Sphaeroforma arctica JP610]|eukprot:XP_014149145.1 hypothetical protein SARC_12231 [Sphaeroforma arctica JP610]
MQAAPIFSALKRGGQRLSDLQRQSDRSDSSADATAPDTPQPREVVCDYLELSATAEELPNFHGVGQHSKMYTLIMSITYGFGQKTVATLLNDR